MSTKFRLAPVSAAELLCHHGGSSSAGFLGLRLGSGEVLSLELRAPVATRHQKEIDTLPQVK